MKTPLRSMDELAQASGLSRPTLSKFFRDPGLVKPATRARIESSLEQYDYRPNLIATNLSRPTSRIVGIVVPSINDPFYAEVTRLIDMRCMRAGYLPMLLLSHGNPAIEKQALETLRSLRAAGAIVAALGTKTERAPRLPIVYLDTPVRPGVSFVGTDNAQSIGLAVSHLLQTGTPPVFVAMPPVNRNAIERRDAFMAAMHKAGHEGEVLDPIGPHHWDFERAGQEIATRFLRQTADGQRTVLCANDRLAFGVLSAAAQAGLSVGRHAALRVAGHDDHPLSRYTCPSLTTVAQDYARLGELAIDSLWTMLAGGAPESRTLPARLISRDSA
ncbi:LacI family transcriptional regulator [Acetobacteraceae bacterium KSS8]|uniref:LacI family transcriptional regulator n=1 Tax=Endosaccharibacter trunci TaxID=2812733 RepID=A0ABT1W5R0_9PROT|nr:LacI family transcriptional regulator [Acetobacteraceae bacterium KSS8]